METIILGTTETVEAQVELLEAEYDELFRIYNELEAEFSSKLKLEQAKIYYRMNATQDSIRKLRGALNDADKDLREKIKVLKDKPTPEGVH